MDETSSRDELLREVDELRASRARVMAIADGERRRIERDLHDGVQQHLVALAVNLQLARELAGSDPDALKTLLVEIGQDVRDTLESVRELAHGVYPALLLDRGLADALRGMASGIAVPVTIQAPADRYPPDIEATVYFCCVAALETVTGAGPGTRATVRVWQEQGSLEFEVFLDGSGVGHDESQVRSALTGIQDRLGAVAGMLTVSSEPGRMRVLGAIPLEDSRYRSSAR